MILPSLLCVALMAGCGDDSESGASSTASDQTAESTAGSTEGSTTESTAAETSDPSSTSDTTEATTSGSDDCAEAATGAAAEDTEPPASFPEGKPEVDVPSELPTELVITDLIEGTGDGAKEGDIVTVNYVGVRTEDGTEFDNSYDRGATFPVTLGTGGVIAGWEQGLLGIKQGGRRQLDIPADLAYGDSPQGDIIQAGDALTFVIDAVSVDAGPPVSDPADKPEIDLPVITGVTKTVSEDLVEGDPCQIAEVGDQVFVQFIAFRGDTGEQLLDSWSDGVAQSAVLDDTTQPVLHGIIGMGVGGRRQLTLAPDALGEGTNVERGLDADTNIVFVIDLIEID